MSGVILATAIGGGLAAGTVTTGAVVAAGIGAGTTLYGGAKSFSEANKARKRGEAAQRDLLKSMQEAKRRIDVNAYEQLSIPKEPYELMREAALVQGATGMQAGVEGETRGAAATAGRLQMAQQAQQAGIRSSMGEQMMAIDQLVAEDDARIQQQLAGIALTEAAGAQEAMRDAEEARADYIAQGMGTLGSIAEGLSTAYAEGNFGMGRRYTPDGLAQTAETIRSGDLGMDRGYELPDGSVLNPNIDPDAYAAFGGTVPNQFEVAAENRQSRRARRQMDRQISTGEFVAPQVPGVTQAEPTQDATAGPLADPRVAAPQPLTPLGLGVAPTPATRQHPIPVLQGGRREVAASAPFNDGLFFNEKGRTPELSLEALSKTLRDSGLTEPQVAIALRRARIERDGSASFQMPPSELLLDYFSE